MRLFRLLSVIIAIVLETTVLPFSFSGVLMAVISISSEEISPFVIFILGLVRDVFSGETLGQSSLFFLILYFISKRYQKKLYGGNPLFQVFFICVSAVGQLFLYYHHAETGVVLGLTIAGFILLQIFHRLNPMTHRGKIEL